jgi:hypothetical protein
VEVGLQRWSAGAFATGLTLCLLLPFSARADDEDDAAPAPAPARPHRGPVTAPEDAPAGAKPAAAAPAKPHRVSHGPLDDAPASEDDVPAASAREHGGSAPGASAKGADDADVAASIYTENGFEIRRDDRLFALYAAFNVDGYDRAESSRTSPFPDHTFHPLRTKVRAMLGGTAEKTRPAIEKYLGAHPDPMENYVEAALTLGAEAPYTVSDKTPKAYTGLGALLADFATTAHLSKTTAAVANAWREMFKALRKPLDAPFGALRKIYRLDEETAPNLVLVPNPLDAPDAAIARRSPEGAHVVVFGLPADEKKIDPKAALKAYAALLADETTQNATVEGLSTAVSRMHSDGKLPRDITEGTLLRESLKAAVEAKLWSANPDAAVDEAFHKGLLFAPEFLKAFGEPPEAFPTNKGTFASQVAARVDIEQALTRLSGGSSIH